MISMFPILLSLSSLFAGTLILLGISRFLEASHRQTVMQVEEEIRRESAEILRRAEEVDALLVEELAGQGDLSALIPAWQQDRTAVLRKFGERPWDWGTSFVETWRVEERSSRCSNLDERLKKHKVIAAMVVMVASGLGGLVAYLATAWSYFGTK
jgi:hypothetical protein